MAKHIIAKVISQKEPKKGCFRMAIEAPAVAKQARAGQFLHIRCGSSKDPLLRRPISIHKIGKKSVEIMYNVVGRGTTILSGKKSGDTIDMIGPLGNGFKISKNNKSVKLLVAGGMGVAPLMALAEELAENNRAAKKIIVLGAKTGQHILCENEFKKLGVEVHIATEDGSVGKKSLATDLAKEIIASRKYKWSEVCIYTAGPMPMIKALCAFMEGCSLESQASLEEKMACGLGACLGCVVDTQAGYKRVCKDGPVFNLCDVICE
ncbi:MAG: dihydroorotate dehydrogenase electron transfer subunit [Candidatus Omnitrophica bacterium]|nr:dihydroorotate dehydrogenase electron transfer subunit [Candidatus Omnitrophota bacterium]